jgi:hypothetical protein
LLTGLFQKLLCGKTWQGPTTATFACEVNFPFLCRSKPAETFLNGMDALNTSRIAAVTRLKKRQRRIIFFMNWILIYIPAQIERQPVQGLNGFVILIDIGAEIKTKPQDHRLAVLLNSKWSPLRQVERPDQEDSHLRAGDI